MNGMPESKLSRLRACWAAGDRIAALGIAAKFPDLGPERGAILTAWGAVQNPRFYRQLGKDDGALIDAGMAALAARYGL